MPGARTPSASDFADSLTSINAKMDDALGNEIASNAYNAAHVGNGPGLPGEGAAPVHRKRQKMCRPLLFSQVSANPCSWGSRGRRFECVIGRFAGQLEDAVMHVIVRRNERNQDIEAALLLVHKMRLTFDADSFDSR